MNLVEAIDEPKMETRGDRAIVPRDKTLVASGLHKDSMISLYGLYYEGKPQASVFIYPSEFRLTKENIPNLDGAFYVPDGSLIYRKFPDLTIEELDRKFLDKIKPFMPFMNHGPYRPLKGVEILEHSFVPGSLEYLQGEIKDLKA